MTDILDCNDCDEREICWFQCYPSSNKRFAHLYYEMFDTLKELKENYIISEREENNLSTSLFLGFLDFRFNQTMDKIDRAFKKGKYKC